MEGQPTVQNTTKTHDNELTTSSLRSEMASMQGPYPFSVGLWIDSSTELADCCTPLNLQRVGFHEVKLPKQMLREAAF